MVLRSSVKVDSSGLPEHKLATYIKGRQQNVDCYHKKSNQIRGDFFIKVRTFLPRHKNKQCHQYSIDVVGSQNESRLIVSRNGGLLLSIWHEPLAIANPKRHKLGVKQRGDFLECDDSVYLRYFLLVVDVDGGVKHGPNQRPQKHEHNV